MYCRACRYDLSRAPKNRCPECGRSFNPKHPDTFAASDAPLSRTVERVRHLCWIRGGVAPLLLLGYGVWVLVTRSTFLPGLPRYGIGLVRLYDLQALAMGIAYVGAASALASAYLLGRVEPCWKYAPVGVFVGIACVVLGWGYAFIWVFVRTFS